MLLTRISPTNNLCWVKMMLLVDGLFDVHNQSENLHCISQGIFSMIGKCSSRAQTTLFLCLIVYDSLSRNKNSVKEVWKWVWGMIRAERVKLKRMACLANQTPRASRLLNVKMRDAWQWPKQPRFIPCPLFFCTVHV